MKPGPGGFLLMNIAVLTIFPEMFQPFWSHGIVRKAVDQTKISVSTLNIRDFASDRHRMTDDRPFGGGSGMVMKPEPLAGAIRAARKAFPVSKTILLSPQGRRFDQRTATEFSTLEGIILVCGRYEGVDERIHEGFIDYEVSIGDYVLTGGELAAMVVIDAVTRLIPGVLGNAESAENDSFSDNLLEHAHYTRPRIFEGETVPDVLLSGNHKDIETWRFETTVKRTLLGRKDLLESRPLSIREISVLKKLCGEIEKIIYAQSSLGIDALPGGQ